MAYNIIHGMLEVKYYIDMCTRDYNIWILILIGYFDSYIVAYKAIFYFFIIF